MFQSRNYLSYLFARFSNKSRFSSRLSSPPPKKKKKEENILYDTKISLRLRTCMKPSLMTGMLNLGFSARFHSAVASLHLAAAAARVMKIDANGCLHVFIYLCIFADSC